MESIIQGEGIFFKFHFFNLLLPQTVIFGSKPVFKLFQCDNFHIKLIPYLGWLLLTAYSVSLHFSVGNLKLILAIFLVICLSTEGEGDQPTTYTALLNDLERSNPKLLGTLNCADLFHALPFSLG